VILNLIQVQARITQTHIEDTGNDVKDVKKRIAQYKKRREKSKEDYELKESEQPGEAEEVCANQGSIYLSST
jgi:hypothetical protein